MTLANPTVALMIDIETLDSSPTAVAWQVAMFPWDPTDPNTLPEYPYFQFLPIQPQLDIGQTVGAETLLWWMTQMQDNSSAYRDILNCGGNDMEELDSLLRSLARKFNEVTNDGKLPHEIWTRGNFDLPILEGLFRKRGIPVPWEFRATRDLRTLESISGVSYKDVPQQPGFVKHRADQDARFQIRHHTACVKALGAAKIESAG